MDFDPEWQENQRRVLMAFGAMQPLEDTRRPRFDGVVNLGHILTIIAMLGALSAMWMNARVVQTDQEARIRALEVSNTEMRSTMKILADSQTQQQLSLREIAISLKYLTKQP